MLRQDSQVANVDGQVDEGHTSHRRHDDVWQPLWPSQLFDDVVRVGKPVIRPQCGHQRCPHTGPRGATPSAVTTAQIGRDRLRVVSAGSHIHDGQDDLLVVNTSEVAPVSAASLACQHALI